MSIFPFSAEDYEPRHPNDNAVPPPVVIPPAPPANDVEKPPSQLKYLSDGSIDLNHFPVPFLNEFVADIERCVFESEKGLVRGVVLAIACAVPSRKYVTPSGKMTAIQHVSIADSGIGKNVVTSTWQQIVDAVTIEGDKDKYHHSEPQSTIAFRQELAEKPWYVYCTEELGDDLERWLKSNGQYQGMPKILKDVHTENKPKGRLAPASYSRNGKAVPVPAILSPAVNLITASQEDRFCEAIANYTVTDGMIGRMVFGFAGREFINNFANLELDNKIIGRIVTMLKTSTNEAVEVNQSAAKSTGRLNMQAVGYHEATPDAEATALEYLKITRRARQENIDHKGNNVPPEEVPLWRSCSENHLKIATALAVWAHPTNPKITTDYLLWARAYIERSRMYLVGLFRDGKLTQATVDKLARKVAEQITDFFFNRTSGTLNVKQHRKDGTFTPGCLPPPTKEFETPQFRSKKDALVAAIEYLEQRDAIERPNKRDKPKVYSLGDKWNSYCDEVGIDFEARKQK